MQKRFLAFVAQLAFVAYAQAPPAEVSSQDASVTFQSKVNLVLVPVVVRDRAGKPVGGLRQEDFQLFDKGKVQIITKFSIEKAGAKAIMPAPAVERGPEEKAAEPDAPGIIAADHFVAFLFDDVHLEFANLAQTRDAALKQIQTLKNTDRVAIYTTSGQNALDFTDDRDKLHQALLKLTPRPIARGGVQQCPDISYYMADLIVNKNDTDAITAATLEAVTCHGPPPPTPDEIRADASSVLTGHEHETRISLIVLKDLVRRMALMPGQRQLVLISPGFLVLTDARQDETEIIDRAIHANVTISAIDARGLYTNSPDITQHTISIQADQIKRRFAIASASAEADILAELADGTGGTFFQNSNDLPRGFRELSTAPDVYYILGFSPQNLKLDGSYHGLKVNLKNSPGLSAKARRGYYAPRRLTDADDEAKEEISQALFSREEMRDIPVEMHTQFFKASETDARLVVMARLDVRKLRYRKADGVNANDVLIVSGLFDRNGNYLQGLSKTLKMHLKDDTLANRLNSGILIRSDFKVAPGTYVIRLVVRDAEGQMMAAQNGAVEIP